MEPDTVLSTCLPCSLESKSCSEPGTQHFGQTGWPMSSGFTCLYLPRPVLLMHVIRQDDAQLRIGAEMGTEVHLLVQQAVFLYVCYAPPTPCSDQICPKINLRESAAHSQDGFAYFNQPNLSNLSGACRKLTSPINTLHTCPEVCLPDDFEFCPVDSHSHHAIHTSPHLKYFQLSFRINTNL